MLGAIVAAVPQDGGVARTAGVPPAAGATPLASGWGTQGPAPPGAKAGGLGGRPPRIREREGTRLTISPPPEADSPAQVPAGAAAVFRRPSPADRPSFQHLGARGYAHGQPTLQPAPEPAEGPERREPGEGVSPEGPATDDGDRGLFVGTSAVAGCSLKAYRTWWGPDELRMESVGGVVALPEARRRGHTAALLDGCLRDMRERGIPISTITTPFSYAFYRQMGWEYALQRRRVTLAPAALAPWARTARGEARFVRCDPDGPALPQPLDAIFSTVMRERYQGAAARTPALWREHLTGERTYAYAWEGPSGPTGYAVLDLAEAEERLRVRELFALDTNACRGLCGLLANFDSQAERIEWDAPPDVRVDLLCPEQSALEVAWTPQGLFRLVDVAEALRRRRAGTASGRLRLTLRDERAPWNRGPFAVSWEDGRATVESGGGAAGAEEAAMDARTFGQIYCGAITPSEAVRYRDAEIGPAGLRLLAAVFETGRPPLLYEWH